LPQGQQAHIAYQSQGTAGIFPQLFKALQGQLTQLQQAEGRPMPQNWTQETGQILVPLQQNLSRLQAQPALQTSFATLLGQIHQAPSFPPQLRADLEQLIIFLNSQKGQAPLPSAEKGPVQAATQQLNAPNPQLAPQTNAQQANAPNPQPPPQANVQQATAQPPSAATKAAPEALIVTPQSQQPNVPPTAVSQQNIASPQSPAVQTIPAEISAELEKALVQVQQVQQQGGKISPELLGRLEGLQEKLLQLPQLKQLAQANQPLLPGLEVLTQQLNQLVSHGPRQPEGGQLGFLSQLFGFHLEAELLKGKQKEALASLKLSLLAMQQELGEAVEEPLKRLEMFQLCKARLAEDQVQFLPLPFHELEEGYLLVENSEREDEATADAPLQLSISLRLSELGNMRVDMLYDKQGLHLRMACEDKEKMEYVQEHAGELEEAIESVAVQGISFAADAQGPARQLLERLLPEALGMLDARI
jgi:hypothetical protein